MKHNKKML